MNIHEHGARVAAAILTKREIEIERLEARVVELEKDKKRIDWLENTALGCDNEIKLWQLVNRRKWADLRLAIDDAISVKEGEAYFRKASMESKQ